MKKIRGMDAAEAGQGRHGRDRVRRMTIHGMVYARKLYRKVRAFWKKIRSLKRQRDKTTRFPKSIFFVYLGVLSLMSGIHYGILMMAEDAGWSSGTSLTVILLYWAVVAVCLTLYTLWEVRRRYEIPLLKLRKAAAAVANGDFSVYVPTTHVVGKQDYLDEMILDFNKMVEELGSIETLKTDFFSSVSHEIKTPLSVIHNNVELLKNNTLSEEQRQECMDTILHATRRLSNLITNILKLNRLEKQVIKPVVQKFDLCMQLEECALQFENVWDEKEIEFEAELEDRVYVEGDEELLALVWTNLLSNAFKFTPPGGTVRLAQESLDDEIVVTVSDTGCGMDEETKKKIFDKFYQGDTSHATEGNGLGLALVRRILELSGGAVTVRSTLGQGSEFTVHLPIVNPYGGEPE